MKFILNKDTLKIENEDRINAGAVNYYEADVEYDESWDGLTIECVIVKKNNDVGSSIAVINKKMFIDQNLNGLYSIGFVGYTIEDNKKIYQISTNLKTLHFYKGAGEIKTENTDLPTPTEWEVYIAQIQEMLKNMGNGTSGEGTTDYNALENKPKINGVELVGDKTPRELGVPTLEDLSKFVTLQYSERIGHFVSNSGVNYEINTKTNEITINDGFLFYLGQRQNDLQQKTTLKIATGSAFSYVVYDLKGTTGNKLLSIVQADFDPTRHVLMCIIRSGYYTIPSANWIEGRYKVDGVLYNPEEPEKEIEKVYVSTTGTDTNNETGDASHPFLTINKAINSGAKTIFVMAGTYKEKITKSNSGGEIEIIAKPLNTTDKKDVIIDLGYELNMVADSNTGLVKGAYTSTTDDFIYKVFVTGEKPIKYVANNTENKEVSLGYTCNLWSGNTRLTPVLSLDECKATSNSWFYNGTNVYANAETGTFVLDNGTNQYGINLLYYKKVKLIGITVKYASEIGTWLKGCSDSEISRCKFMNTGVYHGIKLESTSSTVRNCESAYNGKDGLNIHGVCTADFIDCVSHDNLDDGISHHVESGGMVIGGEYYNNKKGGVCSPTFGSRNGINGVYTHNNGAGIYAVTETDGEYPPCTVSNCMLKENTIGIRASRYTFNCWNNILLNNGTDTSEENGGVINIYNNKECELIETIEVSEENVKAVEFRHNMSKAIVYIKAPKHTETVDSGAQAFCGNNIVGYAWLSAVANASANRLCRFSVKKEGDLVVCENTVGKDDTGNNATISNAQLYQKVWKAESNSPITNIRFFGGSSKSYPIGTTFELWGVKA